ncbi:hypothetical protein DFP72DRAFT_1046347, partial [Ephemerocybe angulata]
MSAIQDLTLEEVADMTALVYAWTMEEYIYPLFSSYIFYYLTTLAEEISIMWPQRWRTGKIVFLVNRYLPLVLIGNSLLSNWAITSSVCTGLYIANGIVLYRVMNLAFEVALLLCLYALLGASQICLALIIATYAGFTLSTTILQIGYFGEASRMLPISQMDRELGYACTWEGKVSPKAARRYAMAGYITLVKSIAISALALFIFFVRYRKHRGTLLQVVRRDSGIYILSLSGMSISVTIARFYDSQLTLIIALRLGSAITGTHSPTLSQANSIGDRYAGLRMWRYTLMAKHYCVVFSTGSPTLPCPYSHVASSSTCGRAKIPWCTQWFRRYSLILIPHKEMRTQRMAGSDLMPSRFLRYTMLALDGERLMEGMHRTQSRRDSSADHEAAPKTPATSRSAPNYLLESH